MTRGACAEHFGVRLSQAAAAAGMRARAPWEGNSSSEYWAMIKKKASKKLTGQKSANKSAKKRLKKETNPAAVRKEVSRIVEAEAVEMMQAVVGEAKKGQLAPVKYLFEMANIFPPQTDPEHATEEEDCLAKILLSRMEAPTKPEKNQEDDGGEEVDAEAEAKTTATTDRTEQECPPPTDGQ